MSHRLFPFLTYCTAATALVAVGLSPISAARAAADDPKPATTAAPATTPEGKALLDATIKAHGGDAFLKMKSLRVVGKGEFTLPQAQGGFKVPIDSVVLTSVAPDKSLLDADTAMGHWRFASRGGKNGGWMSAGEGDVRDLKPEEASSADPTAALRAIATKNLPVRVVPDSELDPKLAKDPDGKALKAFEVTDERGMVTRIYVEADTSLVRRMSSKGKKGEASTTLSGYKEVAGVHLPTSMVVYQNGEETLHLTFLTLEVNPSVSDDTFAKPKPAPKPAAPAPDATSGGTSLP